jgi:2,4-dienoyl-CoA reductase-like NADH-dependent reductase (Old Yellow Enzyme family)/thioredoxin reductase
MTELSALLRPLTIRAMTIRNRVMSTAHSSGFVQDGKPQAQYRLYQAEKARGGIGLTMVAGTAAVARDSPAGEAGHVDLTSDDVVPHLAALADEIRGHGAAVMAQLGHMGRRAVWDKDHWLPVIAPSPVREPVNRSFPKAMEDWDIARVVAGFAAAAKRCEAAGVQGVEIGATYSHLIEQFLSPLTNHRTDAYGGSPENRMRFVLEVLSAVRAAVGAGFVVGLRMPGDELRDGGLTLDDCLAIGSRVVADGLVDYLSVIGGEAQDFISHPAALPGMEYPVAPFLPIASAFKAALDVPIFHAQRITDLATAARAVADGHVDMVAMTRAHIADPHIVRKMMEGRLDDIRPCVGANMCIDRFYVHGQARCLHNPAAGREATMPHEIRRAPHPRRAVVVGGGAAGLEAARVLGLRGHDVRLFEAESQLGGQINIAARAPGREALRNVVDWLESQVRKAGVAIELGIEADEARVSGLAPDLVVIATGGSPNLGWFDGTAHAVSTWDILSGRVAVAENVLLFDDNSAHAAPSCAEYMAKRGARVEFVTPDQAMGQEIGLTKAALFRRELYAAGVVFTPDHALVQVYPEGNQIVAVLRNKYTGTEEERLVDQVVADTATLPRDGLYTHLKGRSSNRGAVDLEMLIAGQPQAMATNQAGAFQLFRIGDAVAARNIHGALYDALRLCKDL